LAIPDDVSKWRKRFFEERLAGLQERPRRGSTPALFLPEIIVVEIKALACQLPKELGVPFSRLTRDAIASQAMERDIVASISGTRCGVAPRILSRKQDAFWICIIELGRASLWGPKTMA
jgi:hypothetical protein